MQKYFVVIGLMIIASVTAAQTQFTVIKNNAATPVKNQGHSGTCWCFSSTAMTESELLMQI